MLLDELLELEELDETDELLSLLGLEELEEADDCSLWLEPEDALDVLMEDEELLNDDDD